MAYDTLNNQKQGGKVWEIGGELGFLAGSVVKYNSVDVTSVFSGASTGVVTVGSALNFGAGSIVNVDSATATAVSNAVTMNKMAGVVTTESLTTAAGSGQAITIHNTTVAAGDLASIDLVGGGTNTRNVIASYVTSANTLTVTLKNAEPTNALNGTILFSFVVFKA